MKHIKHVYFIGIGGIGMSAIARYFISIGKKVAGYDRVATPITKSLEDIGAQIYLEDNVEVIPKHFKNTEETLVVYTPAIPKEHKQLQYFKDNSFQLHKRAKVLGMITKDVFTLAVAGTHGKTTTTAILAHILYESGVKVSAFVGGICENYNSNYISSGNDVVVVEADEFDRSFLQLSPNMSAITSMDADHLDIYGNKEALVTSFNDFKALTTDRFFKVAGLPIEGSSIGINDGSEFEVINLRVLDGGYHFDLKTPEGILENLQFFLPGHHNLRNAVTALALAMSYGAPVTKLIEALKTFRGIQRRFSYKIKTKDLVYIDDYAHHPTEINALYQAVTEMYPGKKVTAVFQPHLFTRTQDFASDFADSLSQFDEIFLLDIYPARELPIEGVTSQWLLGLIANNNKRLISKEALLEELASEDREVVLTIGAGDIGAEVDRIKNVLLK